MPSAVPRSALHERYDWLDQARGVVVLMLMISIVTDHFGGNVLTGDPPIGPPMLSHGFDYFDGYPQMVTAIDFGQLLFMFIMGFVAYEALTSRLKKRGPRSAFWYAARRVGILYFLSALNAGILNVFADYINWPDFLYRSTLTMLAVGSLTAYLTVVLCPNPDRRIAIALTILVAHSLLYAFPLFQHHDGLDAILDFPRFPFGLIGTCAVAIAGTCFGQWYKRDPEDPLVGFHTRIVPTATFAIVAAYCMDWFQPAEHHDATAALQFQAVAAGGFTIMMFFAFNRVGFRLPLLSSLGRNLLIMFIVGGISIDIYLDFIPKSYLLNHPDVALPLAGLVPLLIVSSIALLLDKWGVTIRA